LSEQGTRSVVTFLRNVYNRLGLLVCVGVPCLLVAIALHLTFGAGRSYTWMRPVKILWIVARTGYFPTAACAAYLLGEASRFSLDDVRRLAGRLREPIALSPHRQRVLAAVAMAVAALAIASLVEDYVLTDFFALAILAASAGFRHVSRAQYASAMKQLVFIAVVFTFVSYGFTIEKALLFRFRNPHDAQIVAVERFFFRTEPHRIVAAFAALHPTVVALADRVYYLLFHHMAIVSIFFIGAHAPRRRAEFIAALAICYWIGGIAYYAWPGLGPRYFDPHAYAYLGHQRLSTNYFYRVLFENTYAVSQNRPGAFDTYDYVACMPSLHMAHELVMLYFARSSKIFFALSLAFTSFTAFAVVALGWHYPLDIVFGGLIAAVAIVIAQRQRDRIFPARVLL